MIFGRCGLGDDGDGEYDIGSGSDSGYSGGADSTTLTNVYTPIYTMPDVSAPVQWKAPFEHDNHGPGRTELHRHNGDMGGCQYSGGRGGGCGIYRGQHWRVHQSGAGRTEPGSNQRDGQLAAVAAASQSLTSANAALAALTAAGGTAAQIAVAKQNAANAQAAYLAATAAVAQGRGLHLHYRLRHV